MTPRVGDDIGPWYVIPKGAPEGLDPKSFLPGKTILLNPREFSTIRFLEPAWLPVVRMLEEMAAW